MDKPIRTLVKSLTWQGIGLVSMTGIGIVFTGSVLQGGGIALFSAGLSLIIYGLHERAWDRVRWGRVAAQAQDRGLAER